ncbi:MAG: Bax inhibitor-1/YccA family protein [Cellulosilyticaceae bacterium]
MRSNPMIRRSFSQAEQFDKVQGVMTVKGTRNKSLALLGVLVIAFIASWYAVLFTGVSPYALSTVSGIAALVLAIVTMVKPHLAKTTSLLYATFEGLLVGSISIVFEMVYPGIVTRAVVLTLLAVLFTLLLYREVPTLGQKIRQGVMIATLAVLGVSLIGLFFSIFGIPFVFWGNSLIGIGFSLLVVGIAAANLIVDYDNIAQGAKYGLPKQMEWYFSFGLMVTVIWLYMELLHVLAQIASRD